MSDLCFSKRSPMILLCLLLGCSESGTRVSRDATLSSGQGVETNSPSADRPQSEIPVPAEGQVVIVVETSTGRSIQTIGEIAAGTTLEAVMRQATELNIVLTGTGTTAFVHQIGEVQTGLREGWTYEVDGEFANVGIGQYQLTPPSIVRWSYGEMKADE